MRGGELGAWLLTGETVNQLHNEIEIRGMAAQQAADTPSQQKQGGDHPSSVKNKVAPEISGVWRRGVFQRLRVVGNKNGIVVKITNIPRVFSKVDRTFEGFFHKNLPQLRA